jgi:hypothetical protein
MDKKLQWLLMVVSNAPITNLDEALYKSAWLKELVEQLQQQLKEET